ncbi:MAG: 50S ribosomal protein L13 [Acidobacteria bacterium]|nr:MAG: 50S ribosomal protein L13 [Acidobacteriota bacterium]
MKTFVPPLEAIERNWHLIDAADQVLGRVASRVASILMGKEKPNYTDFLETGDFVVVVNAGSIRLTGKKWDQKMYRSHSGYPGGLKEISARDLLEKHPERLMEHAVKGMLPKNKMGDSLIRKLKVYAGADHPHQAQKPQPLSLKGE